MAGRPSRIKSNRSWVKEFCLENLFDVEQQCKISDREFLRTKSQEITLDGKILGTGIWTYFTKHNDTINSEPMKGNRICEQAVYDYHVNKGNINPEILTYEIFTNSTQKIKNKADALTIQRAIETELFGATISEFNSLSSREYTCKIAIGEDRFEKLKAKITKQIERKAR